MSTGDRLRPENAGAHLERAGLVAEGSTPTVEELGGGVSNVVLKVTWGSDCVVVKQPRPNLDVADDWPADVARVHNEAAATRTYRDIVDRSAVSSVRVPRLRHEDEEHHVIAVDCAPATAGTWKRDLLDGRVDEGIAADLGEVLGVVHRAASDDPEVAEAFANDRPFEQLRLDPYHRTVAERHPEVRAAIEREVERVSKAGRTLVHGDFSPKNVLVDRTGDGTVEWLIDFEVAHWGDPAFDTAFLLNHLLIKSVYNADRQEAYLTAADAFWNAYVETVAWDIEAETANELAVLLLARVDGKSPVEYVERDEVASALRRIAVRALEAGVTDLDAFAALVVRETPR